VATIKSREQYFEPDPTNEIFPLLSLDKHYEMVLQYCQIHGDVPEDVRSYFNAVVTLYLYGWLYYPFFTLASERSFFAVEMALRKRLPPKKLDKKGRDPRNLVDLLREAKAAGLMRDEGFPSLENRSAGAREEAEILGRAPEPRPEEPYVDVLIRAFPWVRNRFAHPNMQSIMPPGPALDGLILAAEIINQLWAKAAADMKYDVKAHFPNELSKGEIKRCLSLIKEGDAVDFASAEKELPLAKVVVAVRLRGEIVGVGAIKQARPPYALRVARKSGFSLDKNMLELGYVARDKSHGGHSLSQQIVSELLSAFPDTALFATTSSQKMKETLNGAGFKHQGNEWLGRDKKHLSLWVRASVRSPSASRLGIPAQGFHPPG
jgi:hypothetical protein